MFFFKPAGVSYSEQGNSYALSQLGTQPGQKSPDETRESLSDTFQAIERDRHCTSHEKVLARLGNTVTADTAIKNDAAIATANALLSTISSAMPGTLGTILAKTIDSINLSQTPGSDVREISTHLFQALGEGKNATDTEKACTIIGKAINNSPNLDSPGDSRKAMICSLLFSALESAPKGAALPEVLAKIDFSRMTWSDVSAVLKEGFTLIEKDHSLPEVDRTLARITLVANSLEVNEQKQGIVYHKILSCMESHGTAPLWEETVKALMKSDFSKISWAEYRVIAGEVLKVVVKDRNTPDEMREIAQMGYNYSLSTMTSDEVAGKKTFDSLTKIYTYIRKKHEAVQEIQKMVENVSDNNEPDKINVIEDDGSQFVEIDGIRLPVHNGQDD